MSYITPAQFRSGLEGTRKYIDQKVVSSGGGGGSIPVYIVGTIDFASNWLSLTKNGSALSPTVNVAYIVMSEGDHFRKTYMWDGEQYILVSQKINAYIIERNETITIPSTDVPQGSTKSLFAIIPDKYADTLTVEISGKSYHGGANPVLLIYLDNVETERIDIRETWSITRTYDLTDTQYKNKAFEVKINTSNVSNYRVEGATGTVVQHLTIPQYTDKFYEKKSGILPDSNQDELSIFTDDGKWTKVKDLIGKSFASNGLVGEVCLYMSPIVPPHFLACDGAQYNAADYPQLFNVLKDVDANARASWGSADWVTTFNVPNIQGDFPRFSGANSHTNQGNGEVPGTHQDGTKFPNISINHPDNDGNNVYFSVDKSKAINVGNNNPLKRDYDIKMTANYADVSIKKDGIVNRTDTRLFAYTSRPTNTSFFGVIRYEASDELSNTPYGGAPVGTIFPYDGTTAPDGYLLCDGTVYNITAQPELAEHIRAQHGSYNFYGGDGSTTFAVPDLRGEFIRGAGTNSRTTQGSGAGVGVHQDGTEMPFVYVPSQGYLAYRATLKDNNDALIRKNPDKSVFTSAGQYNFANGTKVELSSNTNAGYTSRPTNTSYNFIIKASSFDSRGGDNYSTDEMRIGTWIGGEPLYRKTFRVTVAAINDMTRKLTTILNIPRCGFDETMIDLSASFGEYYDNTTNAPRRFPLVNVQNYNTINNPPIPYMAYHFGIDSNGAFFFSLVSGGSTILYSNECTFTITVKYTKSA